MNVVSLLLWVAEVQRFFILNHKPPCIISKGTWLALLVAEQKSFAWLCESEKGEWLPQAWPHWKPWRLPSPADLLT